MNLAGFSVNDEDSFQLKMRKWTDTFETGNEIVIDRIHSRQIFGSFGSTTDTVEVINKETGGTLHLGTKPVRLESSRGSFPAPS